MISWLQRRRIRIERIDAEAEAMIDALGDSAYAEACRLQQEASSDLIASDWERVAQSIARMTTASAAKASGTDGQGEPDAQEGREDHLPRQGRLDELAHMLDAKPSGLRIQFLGSMSSEAIVLKEVETAASHLSEAVVTAANTQWPAHTTALRIIDREGREVFARRRARPSKHGH